MTPETPLSLALRRSAWVGCSILAILIPLVPLGHQTDALLVPDLLFCVTLIWVIREPRITTVGLIALLGLMGDIFLGRPIGLGALALVLTSEAFRQQARFFQENTFLLEWLAAVIFFIFAQLGMSFVLLLTFSETPAFADMMRYTLGLAIIYPFVTGFLLIAFKLRSPQPGQTSDRLGRVR